MTTDLELYSQFEINDRKAEVNIKTYAKEFLSKYTIKHNRKILHNIVNSLSLGTIFENDLRSHLEAFIKTLDLSDDIENLGEELRNHDYVFVKNYYTVKIKHILTKFNWYSHYKDLEEHLLSYLDKEDLLHLREILYIEFEKDIENRIYNFITDKVKTLDTQIKKYSSDLHETTKKLNDRCDEVYSLSNTNIEIKKEPRTNRNSLERNQD